MRIVYLFILGFFWLPNFILAGGDAPVEDKFDPTAKIMSHITDSHEVPVIAFTNDLGEKVRVNLPLPVIIWHEGRLNIFMSSRFKGGKEVVSIPGGFLKLYKQKIFLTNREGVITYDAEGIPTNQRPLNFSITRNTASMMLVVLIIFIVFGIAARKYSKHGGLEPPRGIQLIVEPLVLFVRDDIARAQIDRERADFFVPYLLTLFFFIWFNNLMGLIPFFPGGANLSGNIAFTMTLAVISFFTVNVFGSKHYWQEILVAPGAPFFVKIFLVPVEIIGLFTKPFALMLRLFANITAGHIIILSITSMIFIMKSLMVAPMTILLLLILYSLEFLIAILQAYIFTLLTALFIGMAVNKHH